MKASAKEPELAPKVQFEKAPEDVLKENGYDVGTVIYEIKADKDAPLFEISEIGATCTLTEFIQFSDAKPRVCTIEWLKLLQFWKPSTKASGNQLLLSNYMSKFPTELPMRHVELERHGIYEELSR